MGFRPGLTITPTLVLQPGDPQTITVNVYNLTGGNLLYASATLHGWTWTDNQDKQWRTAGPVS